MNVQSIHSKAFADALPPTYLAQAHYLADYHENGVFSSPDINAIQNSRSEHIGICNLFDCEF